MLDPENDLIPVSSPSISSVSSSDLDTESTGSFFHDRSTTLGTLMGLNSPFPPISLRVPSRREINPTTITSGAGAADAGRKSKKKARRKRVVVAEAATADRRRRWWKLCRDDVATPNSLGEFLEVERRLSDGGEFYGAAAEFEGVVQQQQHDGNRRLLFADGRVLPPARAAEVGPTEGGFRRFPVLLSGICSGGAGSGGS